MESVFSGFRRAELLLIHLKVFLPQVTAGRNLCGLFPKSCLIPSIDPSISAASRPYKCSGKEPAVN